jgi:hypothetical protein
MKDKLVRIFAALPVALAAVVSLTVANVQWTLTSTVYVIGGAGWETVDEPVMRAMLDHRYDTPENTFVNIEWPAYLGTLDDSVAEASDDLYAHITTTDGPKIAIGASGSTFVMNEVMRRLAADPNPDKPSPQDISFVIIGDGERGLIPALVPLIGVDIPLINYRAKPIPVTPYDAIVVKGEYDGLADWPDRPWNLLAVANAWLGSPGVEGFGEIHWDSIFANLDTLPAKNVTIEVNTAGGTTTTYLVPTAELPMLYPLHAMGVPQEAITVLNAVLKPIVDAGYSRNDPAWLKEITQVFSLPSISLPAATVPKRASSAATEVAAPVALAAPAVVKAPVTVDAPAVRTPKRATIRDPRGNSAAKSVAAAAAEQVSDAKPAQARRGANARAAAAR